MARRKKSSRTTQKNTCFFKKLLSFVFAIVLILSFDYILTEWHNNNNSEKRVSIIEQLYENFNENQENDNNNDVTNESSDENFNEEGNESAVTDGKNVVVKDNQKAEYTSEKLEVYFFDVGQADSILLMLGDKVMLVDTGNAGDAQTTTKLVEKNINLTRELKRLGIEEIDVLVLTHPHEDHMGSSYKIINTFKIDSLYANAPNEEAMENRYYQRYYEAIDKNNVHLITPTTLSEAEIIAKIDEYNAELSEDVELLEYNAEDYIRVGDTIEFGTAKITMIAPNSAEYSDTNDYSIVLMVEFEGVKLLLTGDAGKDAEKEMIEYAEKTGFDLDCDILKVGHHGSRTANTEEFISAVKPEYAIVMVAEKNSYGLPDEDVIERLENHNAVIYYTMEQGDIKLVIDNGTYEFDFSYEHEEKPEE